MNKTTLLSQNVKDVLRPMARDICRDIPAPSSWVVSADRKQLVEFILDSGKFEQDQNTRAQPESQSVSREEIRQIVREEIVRVVRVFENYVDVHREEK